MKENRTARLEMRIRPSEKENILRAAKRCGLPVTKYVLKCCSGVEPRQKPPDAFWDILNDLANLGRNMDETQRMQLGEIILSLQELI